MLKEKEIPSKSIWKRSYLGRLYDCDKPFALGVTALLILYAFTFLIRLEIFPCYLFAMYSDIKTEKTAFSTYEVKVDNQPLNMSTIDYRKYTYLMNTISQYDGTMANNGYHPEAQYLDKYLAALGLSKTVLYQRLGQPYRHTHESLHNDMQKWLPKMIASDNGHCTIDKKSWTWTSGIPTLVKTEKIYGDD